MNRYEINNGARPMPRNDFLAIAEVNGYVQRPADMLIVDPYRTEEFEVYEQKNPNGETNLTVRTPDGNIFESPVINSNVVTVFRAGVAALEEMKK